MDLTIMHQSPERAEACLSFAAHDPWVREHFPHMPILPGSLALAAILHLTERLTSTPELTVRRFRCHTPLCPGSYRVSVIKEGTHWHGSIEDNQGQHLVRAEIWECP